MAKRKPATRAYDPNRKFKVGDLVHTRDGLFDGKVVGLKTYSLPNTQDTVKVSVLSPKGITKNFLSTDLMLLESTEEREKRVEERDQINQEFEKDEFGKEKKDVPDDEC